MGLGDVLNDSHVFFRAPVLLALVWFLWGINVWVFRKVHLDYAAALGFDRASTLSPRAICSSAVAMLGVIAGFWFLYTIHWPFEDALVAPSAMYILSFFVLIVPLDVLHRRGRERLIQNFFRVVAPPAAGVLFVEVVLGDMLTSMSKALADVQVSLCMLLSHSFALDIPLPDGAGSGLAPTLPPGALQQACAESWLRPLVTSLPFLLRFRQCLVAYRVTGKAFPNLVNAAKYASALPVIFISAFAHYFPSSYGLFLRKMWLVSITFNSFFSFLWDIVMDFGLLRSDTQHVLLRSRLYYMSDPTGENIPYQPFSQRAAPDAPPTALEAVEELPDVAGRGSFAGAGIAGADASAGIDEKRVNALTAAAEKAITIGGPQDDSLGGSWGGDDQHMSRRRGAARAQMAAVPVSDRDAAVSLSSPPVWQPLLPQTPIVYYVAIVLDFLLRVLWSFKLSVHLHLSQEGLTFVLEICEVLRRFLWLFFRIEWQCIEMEEEAAMNEDAADVENPVEGRTSAVSAMHWAAKAGAGHQMRSRTPSDRAG